VDRNSIKKMLKEKFARGKLGGVELFGEGGGWLSRCNGIYHDLGTLFSIKTLFHGGIF